MPNFVFKKSLHPIDHERRIAKLKGIVSRDFGGLQMILVNGIGVPDVPLEVYSFLNYRFHIVI